MRNIKTWNKFYESNAFILSEKDKDVVGFAILKACYSVWGYINRQKVRKFGTEIDGEILRKSKNNRILINYIKDISDCDNVDDLVLWIDRNSENIWNPNGIYFKTVIGILTGSTAKGNSLEDIAKEALIEYFEKIKGISISTFSPKREKDQEGYDIFFRVNDGVQSAQVKTLVNVTEGTKRFRVNCKGHLKELVTNYLIAVNEKECYIFRTWGQYVDPTYFSLPKSNLVFHKVY
jgi:hypothetical protein